MKHFHDQRRGAILLMALVLLAIGSMLSASFYAMLNRSMASTWQAGREQAALSLADAGLEKTLAELRSGNVAYVGETDTPLGEGRFSITLEPLAGSTNTRRVTATGLYAPKGSLFSAKARVLVDVELDKAGRVTAVLWREGIPCR